MMLFRRLNTLALVLGALLLPTLGMAQERTASGGMDAAVTWSTISGQLNVIKGRSDAMNVRLDQAVKCGRKNKLYAPGSAEADADGCVFSALDPASNATVNNMILCALKGAVYSSATNSCVYPGKERWYEEGAVAGSTTQCGSLSGQCSSRQLPPPAGYVVCTGNDGKVARLCSEAGKRCYIASQYRVDVPKTCRSRGGDSSDQCRGGGSYNVHTYHRYRCE